MKNKKNDLKIKWILCESCEDWFCIIHNTHVYECDCLPIEDWIYDPRTGDKI